MPIRTLLDLAPDEFENLAYDLLHLSGFKSVIWRTPGADGGRDIQSIYYGTDASGFETTQKWYAECKRYSSSVSWPVVFEKVAYAQNHAADFLLMISTENPSPTCETEIQRWNSCNHLQIRFWRGYQIEGLLRVHLAVAVKYGLAAQDGATAISMLPLLLLSVKLAQTAEAHCEVSQDPIVALRASALVGELSFQRTQEIEKYGRPTVTLVALSHLPSWINATDIITKFDTVGFLAFAACLRHFCSSETVSLSQDGASVIVTAVNPRIPLAKSAYDNLMLIAIWSELYIEQIENYSLKITARKSA